MSERYVGHTVAWELPNRDSVTKGNYNLADIETKYLPIQTEVVSDNKDKTINKLQQRIAELEEQLKNCIRPKFKIGQEVWFVSDPSTARYAKVRHMKIEEISISSIFVERGVMYAGDDWAGISESELFATKQEAQAKLKELGESE